MFSDETLSRGRLGSGYRARNLVAAEEAEAGPVDSRGIGGLDLAEYWRLAIKHRFLIGGALAAAILIGLAATLLTTPTYTAEATLQIDREAARVLDVEDLSSRDSQVAGEEFFQTQYGLLKSRSLAERVVDSLGLASGDNFLNQMEVRLPERNNKTAAAYAALRREAVIATVERNFSVAPIRTSRLVNIRFESPDPVLSARITNSFAQNFIQSNLDRRFESSQYAREFLEERIAQTKAKLEDAERQLVIYATQQQIITVNEPGTEGEPQSLNATDLAALNSSLSQARAVRIAAQERWQQSRSAPLLSVPEVIASATVQNLMEERAKLDARYQQNSSAFLPEWPAQQQLRAQIDELDRQINSVARSVLRSLQSQYEVAARQESSLQAQVDAAKADVLDLRNRSIQYNILQRELDTSRTLYEGLLQRYKEVGVTGGVTTNNVSIVDSAEPPSEPSGPKLLINLAIASLLGLGLGVVAALILEALDETLATPEDVESKLGLPVLGVVPLIGKDSTPAAALSDPRSAFSESYYSLRTALQFSTADGAPRVMLVTSSRPAEGKSTTAYATALSLARIGKRVLLADGDLRNPSMHRVVGTSNDHGVSNLLSGAAALAELVEQTSEKNLWFIASGPLPPNPAELWGGERLARFLSEAAENFDHVVIDGPPVLGFADAPLLAAAVDGTLFVLESRGARRAQARGALRRLLMGDARLLGAVLTKFNAKSAQYGGYDYAYDYDYGPGASSTKRKG